MAAPPIHVKLAKNHIGAPKCKIIFGALLNFAIAPHKVIDLPTLQ